MAVQSVTKEQFQELVLNYQGPNTIIVDFYADWCGPCKMIAPVLEQISNEQSDVTVYKLDVDENPELASQYNIMSIPNVISFRGGKVYKRVVGAQPKARMEDLFR